jgi:uncharacterized protein (TIGR02118 family)
VHPTNGSTVPYFIALWTKPQTDLDGFEEHYRTTHAQIVSRWPGFRDAQVLRTPRAPMGDPEFHIVIVVELEDVGAALRSPEAKEAIEDAQQLMSRHGNRMTTLTGDTLA